MRIDKQLVADAKELGFKTYIHESIYVSMHTGFPEKFPKNPTVKNWSMWLSELSGFLRRKKTLHISIYPTNNPKVPHNERFIYSVKGGVGDDFSIWKIGFKSNRHALEDCCREIIKHLKTNNIYERKINRV